MFENTSDTKYRFKKLGTNRAGEMWYSVECKSTKPEDKEKPWDGGLAGTVEFLGLTKQQIDWAK